MRFLLTWLRGGKVSRKCSVELHHLRGVNLAVVLNRKTALVSFSCPSVCPEPVLATQCIDSLMLNTRNISVLFVYLNRHDNPHRV